MRSGNTTINPEALKFTTKEEFKILVKGKISDDLDELWEQICKINGNDGSFKESSTKRKKRSDGVESNAASEPEQPVHESDN